MSNYLILDAASSLIISVIASTVAPISNNKTCMVKVSDAVLDKYYKLASKKARYGTLVGIGELASISPSFLDSLGLKVVK